VEVDIVPNDWLYPETRQGMENGDMYTVAYLELNIAKRTFICSKISMKLP
jgi:hypothetical protein